MSRTHLATLFCATLLTIVGCTKDNNTLHKPPIVRAGTSQTVTMPDSAALAGTAWASDSVTGGHIVAYLWSEVSGPDLATIINPGSPATSVKFDVPGNYLFQLEATDDKGATGVDTVTVIVKGSAKTLTLQPANNPTEYTVATYNGGDATSLANQDLPVCAWTINSLPITVRNLVKFDLSSIPSNATILSANLYLYSYPPPTLNGNFQDANYGVDNTLLVQQVAANWSPSGITWFNQPSTTTTNQVVVPSTTQSQLDLNLDVKAMVSSMVNGNANYGFLLKLQNETIYTSRLFVSSHNPTYTTKYPKLVISYQITQ